MSGEPGLRKSLPAASSTDAATLSPQEAPVSERPPIIDSFAGGATGSRSPSDPLSSASGGVIIPEDQGASLTGQAGRQSPSPSVLAEGYNPSRGEIGR